MLKSIIKFQSLVFTVSIAIALIAFFSGDCSAAADSTLKGVMQVNTREIRIVIRGLRNISEILDVAKAQAVAVDLKLVVSGPSVDLFQKGVDAELTREYKKVSNNKNVQFLVDEPTLKRINKKVPDLLPGFVSVASGPYEVLNLEKNGYLYIKP